MVSATYARDPLVIPCVPVWALGRQAPYLTSGCDEYHRRHVQGWYASRTMWRISHQRVLLAATVVVSLLAPTALCFAGTVSSVHQCCKMSESVREAPAKGTDCCVVSAPAPNQAAVVTPGDQQTRLAAPAAISAGISTSSLQEGFDSPAVFDHSPPAGSLSRTILRI